MGENLHKKGIEKIKEKDWRRFTVALERTYHLKLPIHSKTYSSDLNSTSDYVRIPPRTGLESWLTVRKLIISPVLSSTLLQIYCIGLIGLISYSFWVWATICDLTVIFCLISSLLLLLLFSVSQLAFVLYYIFSLMYWVWEWVCP